MCYKSNPDYASGTDFPNRKQSGKFTPDPYKRFNGEMKNLNINHNSFKVLINLFQAAKILLIISEKNCKGFFCPFSTYVFCIKKCRYGWFHKPDRLFHDVFQEE
jgi:hypothetical protein